MNIELQKLRQEAREAAEQAREDFHKLFGYSHDAERKGEPTGWRAIRNADGSTSWKKDERGTDVPPAKLARASKAAHRHIERRPRAAHLR